MDELGVAIITKNRLVVKGYNQEKRNIFWWNLCTSG